MLARVTSRDMDFVYWEILCLSVCHLEFYSGDSCLFFFLFCLVIFICLHISSVFLHFIFFLSFFPSCLYFINVLFFIPFLSLIQFFYFLYFPLSLPILSILFPSLALSSDIGLGNLQY